MILAKPVDYLGPRLIYIRSQRGETFWSMEDATELLVQLTSALERAIDPTPLPAPESIPPRIPSPRPSQPNIEDLL